VTGVKVVQYSICVMVKVLERIEDSGTALSPSGDLGCPFCIMCIYICTACCTASELVISAPSAATTNSIPFCCMLMG
jgi:hypothetical protein